LDVATGSDSERDSFLVRNEFLLRRLHSLSGLIPVGAYMCIHLLTNSSVLDSPATFQKNVYSIHSLGRALPFVEWTFIFIPILFHAIFGFVIIRGGLSNSSTYTYTSNVRYTLQRITGMIAFLFIMWHVFHMHGWFHAQVWLDNVASRLGGANFRPYNAASSAGEAMQASFIIPVLYAIGTLACVFHLANGIWTMGITWGVWTTPQAQARANYVCLALGLFLAAVGMSALVGFNNLDVDEAKRAEDKIYNARVAAGELQPDQHKRASSHADDALDEEGAAAAHGAATAPRESETLTAQPVRIATPNNN
jgi:succinate dehydrogenase / fumarate reductase cytochrome b subunit